MTWQAMAGNADDPSLAVRPPLQERSRAAWQRVLDAGVTLLEDGGYEAFTIAAVCERAHVPPRALYARVDSKDALFLAVYEHAMTRVRAEQAVLSDVQRWRGLPAEQVVGRAVREVAGIFARHAALLRSVVLVSGVHPEVHRRGARYTQELGDEFTTLLLRAGAGADLPDPELAVRAAFDAVFSTLVLRTAYGPRYATSNMDEQTFIQTLAGMLQRYLFAA